MGLDLPRGCGSIVADEVEVNCRLGGILPCHDMANRAQRRARAL